MTFCTRTISTFVFSLCLLFFGMTNASAQNGQFDVRFTIKNFDCANNKVTMLLQVKAHDASHTFFMGDANYRFDYDPRVIKNPAIVSQENFSNQPPSSDLSYVSQNLNGSSVGPTLGTVSLNTIYGGGGLSAKLVPATWTNVSCIRFDVQDATKCFDLVWHDDQRFPITGMNEIVLSGLNDGNYDAYVVAAGGVFQNYSQCTPSVCSAMTAIDDINVTNKNTTVAGSAATNDVSLGGATTYTLLSQTTGGTMFLAANGTYTFTPTTGFVGEHKTVYQVCNAAGLCDTATIIVQVLDDVPIGTNAAPIAQNDNAQTVVNTPVTGSVLTNDLDPNGNTLTVTTAPITSPTNGGVVINPDGTFTYTPTNGFVGQDTFRYKVCDNGTPSLCDTAMVVLVVGIDNNGTSNNPPNAQDDSKTTTRNTAVTIPVKGNDTDPNGNTLSTPSVSTNPTNGSVVVNGDGTITYTPNNNYIGPDKFTYTVCDNGTPVLCDTATVYIDVTKEANLPPVITKTPITTPEDSTKTICIPVTDPNTGQVLTATLCTGYPKNGTAGAPSVSNGQVCFTFTPTPNYSGVDTICMIVCDNGNPSLCDTAKIPVTITPVPDPPVVTKTPVTVPEDSTITICQTITDPDVGDTFTATLCSQPAHGVAGTPTITGNQVCVQYTPTANYNGKDTVCIIVCDQTGRCDTAKVPVTVTSVPDVPVVTEVPVTVPEDSTITICQTITDPDVGDTFTATLCSQPAHGLAGTPTITGNQVCVQYTPTANYNGKDTVCIIVCDQTGRCDTAKVPVTVTPVADKPVVTKTPVTVPEDSTITICQTITDPDVGDTFTATLCSQPAHGLAGTPIISGNQVCVQYSPTANYNGKDTVCIIVCDQTGRCDTAKVPVTVTSVPDVPVVTEVPVTVPEDSTITICQTITDPDVGDTFTASLCSQPAHGLAGTPIISGNQVCVQYSPTANYNGKDTVCIIVCDQTGRCDTAKVPVTVTPVADKPVVTKTPVTVPEDSTITICQTITDPDVGDTFTATLCSQPAHGLAGTPIISGNQVCVQYSPTANYNGKDTVCIIVCDQTGRCDTAKVPVTVTSVPDVPVVTEVPVTVPEDSTITICQTITDPDVGDTFTATLCSQPAHGVAGTPTITGNQVCVQYTPTANYNGKDTVCIIVCDQTGRCDTAKVPVTVTPVLDPPVVTEVPVIVPEDSTITICQTITDPDVGDTFTASLCSQPAHGLAGTPIISGNQVCVQYSPTANYNGKDTVCIIVCDQTGRCDTAKVPVTVTPVADKPVVTKTPVTVPEDSTITICQTITDPDVGDTFTASLCSQPAHGVAGTPTITGNQVCVQYTPTANYNGKDTVCIVVCDQTGRCDTAKVPVTVTPVLDPPVVTKTPVTIKEDSTVTICQTITDPDLGDTFTATLCSQPAHGVSSTPIVTGNQVCVQYVPTANYNGKDTVCIIVCDQTGKCDTAKVPVTITPVNDTPVVTETPVTIKEDSTVTICQTITDPDAGDTFTASLCSQPAHGAAGTPIITGNQVCVQYVPTANYNGKDTVCIIVCDQAGKCDTAKVPVTITPVNDAPVVTKTPVTIKEDSTVTICQTITDPDAGDTFTATLCSQPAHGTSGTPIVTGNQVCVQYVPTANYNGKDTVCIIVCDQTGRCDTAKVPVTITPVNDKPDITGTSVTTNDKTPVTVCLPITDPDLGDTFTPSLCGTPATGVTSTPVISNGQICVQYLPTLGASVGTQTICVQVCDAAGTCDTAHITVKVLSTNQAPIATNDINNTVKNTPTNGNVLLNDNDPDFNTLTPTVITPAKHGNLVLSPNGTYTYTPTTGFIGTDSVTYKVCDNGTPTLCDTAIVVIEVREPNIGNQAPIANNDNTKTPSNHPVVVAVTSNDYDPDNGQTINKPTLVGTPIGGTSVVNPDGTVTFTPNNGFIGDASFKYAICDNGTPSLCDTATVFVVVYPDPTLVNVAPVAVDDANSTTGTTPVSGTVATNDSDPNAGQTLTYTGLGNGAKGTATVNPDGTYTYTANPNTSGWDVFSYKVCDNGVPSLCDTAIVSIFVNPVGVLRPNTAPVATPDNPVTNTGTPVTINVKANDYDPNGDALTTPTITTPPTCGNAVVNANGTITFTPNTGFTGVCTFIYQVCDNRLPAMCDTALVSVKVDPLPASNRPPVAINDGYVGLSGQTIASKSVAANDSDPDAGQTLSFTQLTFPAKGIVSFNATGVMTYFPLATFTIGRDSFKYKVCDNGTPSLCDTAWVFVEYTADPTTTNVAPIAIDDNAATTGGTKVNIPVKANDGDPNGVGTLGTPSVLAQPSCGTATVLSNGTIDFTPTTGFVGDCTFKYVICDNGSPALCDTASVTVTVTAPIINVNRAPIAQNDATTTPESTPVNGSVAGNDSDLDAGQTLTFSKLTNPANGSVVFNPDGTFIYTPTTAFVGRDSFTYQVCDNGSPVMCTTATSVIVVTATGVNQNDAPIAGDDKVTTTPNTPVIINVKANDIDPDGSANTLTNPVIIGTPVGGTPSVNPDGTVTFIPTTGFTGTATFTYKICDNGSPVLCDTAVVTITVIASPINNNINLAPVAIDDAKSGYKNATISGSTGTNDSDPNAGQVLTYSIVSQTTNGLVTSFDAATGNFVYTPIANYVGADYFVYSVCDNGSPSLCDTAVVYFTILDNPCITVQLKALLEGPYSTSTGKMRTVLNQRGLLPGQTPVGQFAVKTAAGHPYKGAPWNYTGTEGDTITSYPSTVVDWVLVSLRSTASNLVPVWRCAAWLHEDGTITIPGKPCIQIPSGVFYIVIEHRNHIGVMSPAPVSIVNNVLNFDFTTGETFMVTNPPSFGSKALSNGKWVMYAGDGKKDTQNTNFDVNFNDSQMWKLQSGIFDQYRYGDFNLDADVNFSDQVLWKANNGRYSGIPH